MCTRAGVRTKFWLYDFSSDRVRTSDYTVASGANLNTEDSGDYRTGSALRAHFS